MFVGCNDDDVWESIPAGTRASHLGRWGCLVGVSAGPSVPGSGAAASVFCRGTAWPRAPLLSVARSAPAGIPTGIGVASAAGAVDEGAVAAGHCRGWGESDCAGAGYSVESGQRSTVGTSQAAAVFRQHRASVCVVCDLPRRAACAAFAVVRLPQPLDAEPVDAGGKPDPRELRRPRAARYGVGLRARAFRRVMAPIGSP